ncbi:PH domain-like protein [Aaosphaeria arxii CBS 175.79]|uniref:PH domain-like protein n=1 Tax=Aaosphaeria arxii CBS 175.79 TaxID=1450172 RepID=A0A6A5XF88_9PLEO|nr:PH domain-like protein [Aaosphaeria arxii CBS 175.79]KAF2011529.1 PH domain-like protein [Aaosphaeria arxii CBS 175.79]
MAEIIRTNPPSQAMNPRSSPMKIQPPTSQLETVRPDHVHMMSPVNQNGSYEFDRVVKAGTVVKRTRKTKQWKSVHLVLRPNLLSIYKDKDETKLRHQINLSDLTAVARQKDSKKKMQHVFGLFSPARNYHLSAPTEKDAQEWVDLIRAEARIDADEEELILLSPGVHKTTFSGLDRNARRENIGSSSSEAEPRPSSSINPETMHSARRPSHTLAYSGNEHGSFSDFSDTAGGPVQPPFQRSSTSLRRPMEQNRNTSQVSNVGATPDDERVVYHGWLYVLKSKGGVRQWKKVWVVLRQKTLGLYKNSEEYSANLILPFSSIIDAVDIDPASKSKKYCMQIISEEKNFRFCASDEDSLAKWLGAFKSLLVKRREAENQRVLQAASSSGNA